MNILIKSNSNSILNNLSIDVIKTLVGEFTRDDLEKELSLLTYNYVIIDINSIKNYYDDNYLYSFLEFFPSPNQLIIVLNDEFASNSKIFLNKLINKGYYNFATSDSAITRLIERPNTYEDVKKFLEGNDYLKEETIVSGRETKEEFKTDKMIIGIENGVPHSGATTFMYFLVNSFPENIKVKGIEMNKYSSSYFKDDKIITCDSKDQLEIVIKTLKDIDIFVIDLNNSNVIDLCKQVLYLVEPGTIKINKLIKGNSDNYQKLIGKNIILNRNTIPEDQLSNFEYETKLKIFGTIPNLNDRIDNQKYFQTIIKKLSIQKPKKPSIFDLFRKKTN